MSVNAAPAYDQIGAMQVSGAISRRGLSVLAAVFDLAINAYVRY
jgi:hypothetical protein